MRFFFSTGTHRSKENTNKQFYNFPFLGTAMCRLKAIKQRSKDQAVFLEHKQEPKYIFCPSWVFGVDRCSEKISKFHLAALWENACPIPKSSHPFSWLISFTSPLSIGLIGDHWHILNPRPFLLGHHHLLFAKKYIRTDSIIWTPKGIPLVVTWHDRSPTPENMHYPHTSYPHTHLTRIN